MKPSAPPPQPSTADRTGPHAPRRAWMAVLARASRAELEAATAALQALPAIEPVRLPEAGMVMLRGRIGGTGSPFNLGEASVTRCALRVGGGALGVAYVLGRDKRKAELAALFDALLQDPQQHAALQRTLITPLAARQESKRLATSRAAATSKVEFFTMVRGDA